MDLLELLEKPWIVREKRDPVNRQPDEYQGVKFHDQMCFSFIKVRAPMAF